MRDAVQALEADSGLLDADALSSEDSVDEKMSRAFCLRLPKNGERRSAKVRNGTSYRYLTSLTPTRVMRFRAATTLGVTNIGMDGRPIAHVLGYRTRGADHAVAARLASFMEPRNNNNKAILLRVGRAARFWPGWAAA